MALGSGGISEGGAQPPSSDWARTLWFEVWADRVPGAWMPYLLVVRATDRGAIEVSNPHGDRVVLETFDTYDRVLGWMAENGYHRVEGRWPDGVTPEPFTGDEYLPWGSGETLWFEAWTYARVYSVVWLVVVRASSLGAFEVTDPQHDGDLTGMWGDYGRLLEWMDDNEYRRIQGRWVVGD